MSVRQWAVVLILTGVMRCCSVLFSFMPLRCSCCGRAGHQGRAVQHTIPWRGPCRPPAAAQRRLTGGHTWRCSGTNGGVEIDTVLCMASILPLWQGRMYTLDIGSGSLPALH